MPKTERKEEEVPNLSKRILRSFTSIANSFTGASERQSLSSQPVRASTGSRPSSRSDLLTLKIILNYEDFP